MSFSVCSGFGTIWPVIYSGERFLGQGVSCVVGACLQEEERKWGGGGGGEGEVSLFTSRVPLMSVMLLLMGFNHNTYP